MKLYLISQDINSNWDTYSEAVVCAENEEEARKIHPDESYDYKEEEGYEGEKLYGTWAKKVDVQVEEIGEGNYLQTKGVICASFHAG